MVTIFYSLDVGIFKTWLRCFLPSFSGFIPGFNTLRPRQNGRHFADDTFTRIFVNENVTILIEITLKFVPKGPINNIPSLVQIMAWRRPGDKLLSEPMMVCLPTHICVTRPQWVNIFIGIFNKFIPASTLVTTTPFPPQTKYITVKYYGFF